MQKRYTTNQAGVPQIGPKAEAPAAPAAPAPDAKPIIVKKHASWPREAWVLIVFVAGVIVGAVTWDWAQNRNADNVIRAVTAGQAIERAKDER